MKFLKQLYVQVLIGVVLGVIVGYLFPSYNNVGKLIGEGYINLIKMLIAPLIFFTAVVGIAGSGNMGEAGRIGGKAIIYFQIASAVAMILGIVVVNLLHPGAGVSTQNLATSSIDGYVQSGKDIKWSDFIMHIIPSNVVDSFAKGEILQVLVFSILFGIGLGKLGAIGQSVVVTFDKINKVLFEILNMITMLSPLGAFGGMMYTMGKFGFSTLIVLGKLLLTFYLAAGIFVFLVLGLVMWYYKLNIFKLLAFIKAEILIVVGSFSSESVLSNLIYKMEEAGCAPSVVGLVIPAGFSFNLDGTSIYLSMAVVFIAQVFNVPLDFWQQATIIGILMVTSKGAGGISGSGFVVLASSLAAIKVIPVEGLALLIGIDRFMSQGRAITNTISNAVATVVIARNENLLDMDVYNSVVEGKTVTQSKVFPLTQEAASKAL